MPEIGQVVALVEEAVFADPGTLSPASRLEEVSGWDSSSMVFFAGEVTGRWGIELSAGDLRECRSVAELADRVRAAAGG